MKIEPHETTQPMSAPEKILGGLKDSVYPTAPAAWLTAAGWKQLIDGSPNYGVDKGAFGQRLGASAIRDISETVFIKSAFAPLFREDPRYYQLGRGHSIVRRGLYAATRVFVIRTDDRRVTPNYSLFAGKLGGAALTVTYYPARNTTFEETVETFAGSLGGSALGFLVDEFLDDGLRLARLKKPE